MAEFLPHNSAINSRFQSEIWPIFENHATKNPAHLGILRVRGGSSLKSYPFLYKNPRAPIWSMRVKKWFSARTKQAQQVMEYLAHK